jgi:hypothetical protein
LNPGICESTRDESFAGRSPGFRDGDSVLFQKGLLGGSEAGRVHAVVRRRPWPRTIIPARLPMN